MGIQTAVPTHHTMGIVTCAAIKNYSHGLVILIAVGMLLITITLKYAAAKKLLCEIVVLLVVTTCFTIHRLTYVVITGWCYEATVHHAVASSPTIHILKFAVMEK